MAGVVRVAILGNSSSAVNALRKTNSSARSLGSRFGSLTKAAAKYALLGVGALAAASVKLANMAVDDQKSMALMANAFRNAAGATDKQIASVERWITAQGEALGITDDQLRPALSRLVGATGDVTKAQKLASLAMDVSVGRGKELSTVTEALAKGAQGNTTGLARLGAEMKNADGSAKSFGEILDELAKKHMGAASDAADTAAGKYTRMKVALSETAEDIGTELIPAVTAVGDWILDEGIPAAKDLADVAKKELGGAMQDLTGWFTENKDELRDLGAEILDVAIPALRTAAGFVGDLVGFFSALPGPVKEFGAEIAVAAAGVVLMNKALGALNLTSLISNLGTAEGRMAALGRTARMVAGVGGLALLIDSTHRADGAISALEETIGGAAVGGAVGGPWGALFGGTIGALHSAFSIMFSDVEEAGQVLTSGKQPIADYAASFDQTTGAITRETRALILNQAAASGVLGQIKNFGIDSRTLIDAVLGNKGAIDKVNASLASGTSLTVAYTDVWGRHFSMQVKNQRQADKLTEELIAQGNTIDEVRQSELDLAGSKSILDFIGKQTDAWKASSKEQRKVILATQDLTGKLKGIPEKVATKIEETGIVPTTRGIANLTEKYNLTPKQVRTLIEASGADTSWNKVDRLIKRLADLHDKTVTVTTHYAVTGHPGPASGGQDPAHTTTTTPRTNTAQRTSGQQAGQSFLDGMIAALTSTSGLEGALDKINKIIQKALDKKYDDKALTKHVSAVLKGLKDEYSALKANARAQERMNALLEEARGTLQDLKDQSVAYAKTVADSLIAFGNIVSLGAGNGYESAAGLVELLRQKVLQAQQFAALIQALTAAGLNSTAIQQLLDAGVEAGLGTAQAILDGGPGTIAEINALQAQLAATGTALGASTASTLYDAGIAVAQGLVDGLAANADALVHAATKLAKALIKAVKKALGIKSPSKIFKDIGKQTVLGLGIGLDEVYVKRQGQRLAAALDKGFGTPALAAFLDSGSGRHKMSIDLRLTAEQVDQLSRGRDIQADLDAWSSVGGRAHA